MLGRLAMLLALFAATVLAAPGAAFAHGVHGEAETIPEYAWLGTRHMIAGWDHLLFIIGVVLLAGSLFRAAKLVSLFVAGHSLTLLIATLAGWQFNAEVVDVVIALSLAYVGWRLLKGRPSDWRWTGVAVFGFGLVHGVGLATRLQELPLPSGGALVARILAFNVGVEIGQLAVLSVVVALAYLIRRQVGHRLPNRRLAGAGFAALGLVAAVALAFVAVRPDSSAAQDGEPPVAATTEDSESEGEEATPGSCVEEPFSPDLSQAGAGGHLSKAFYEPGESVDTASLQHVMGDGYIILVYHPSLTADEQSDLRQWVEQAPGVVGLPGGEEMEPALEAATVQLVFTCDEFDLDALSDFRSRWFTGR